jgi:hypothetical protein
VRTRRGVTAGDLDQAGQRAADWGGVEDEVDRAVADRLDPLHHTVAVGGDGGAELAQPLGVGGAGGGDHPQAAHQRDLHGGEADRAAGPVDEDGPAGCEAERDEVQVGGVEGHRQGRRLGEVEAVGNGEPVPAVRPEPPVTKTRMPVSLRKEVKLTQADRVPLTPATIA